MRVLSAWTRRGWRGRCRKEVRTLRGIETLIVQAKASQFRTHRVARRSGPFGGLRHLNRFLHSAQVEEKSQGGQGPSGD
jgi:hypothetical protein